MLDKLTQLSQPVVSISSNMFLSQQPLRESKDLGLAMDDSFSSKFSDLEPKKVFWMSLKIKLVEIGQNWSQSQNISQNRGQKKPVKKKTGQKKTDFLSTT